MTNTSQVVSKAARSLKNENEQSGLITLSTGVILTPTIVPNMLYLEIMGRFKAPKIPRFFNEDLGREEENPNHPDYIAEMQEYTQEMSKAMIDLMILFGTEINKCPKGVDPLESSKWVNKLKLTHFEFDPDDEYDRYLNWIKAVAAPSDEDIEAISVGVGRLSGVVEDDVQDAVNQFRD